MSTADPHAKGNYTVGVKKTIVGSKVINAAQEHLGTIEDIVIDTRTDQVAYAILSFGGVLGMGDKHFAIPWDAIQFDAAEKYAVLNLDKDLLESAPGFHKDRWPDMTNAEWANRIHSHYEHGSQGGAGAQ
jgi:sporulation protein YlmC with PRC-barrel domain